MKVKAVAYTRVSTQEQADSGLSLEGQEKRIAAYCEAREWELVGVISDAGFSGGTLQRPGLQRVLELVKRGEVDVVCVLKLDRLTRSVKDLGTLLETFDKKQVAFSSVSDNFDTSCANGRLILNVLGSVAQWEREIISERTEDALAVKKAQHRRVGELPFGFTLAEDGDALTPNEKQLETVAQVAEWRRAGGSLNGIARQLNALGIATAKGSTWAAQTVKRVLRNNLYVDFIPGFVPEGVRPC